MNTKINISIILLLLLAFAVGCEKSTKLSDSQSPVITDIRINDNDTVIVTGGDTIFLNNDASGNTIIVPLGHEIIFSAHITDNHSITAYKLALDTLASMFVVEGDTLHPYRGKGYGGPILVDNDTTILRKRTLKTDTLIRYTDDNGIPRQKRVQEGIYQLGVYAIDKAGNQDSVMIPVKLLRRKTIIADR